MSDERFRLLVGAGLGAVAVVAVAVLLALGIPVEQIVTGFAAVGSLIGVVILSEVQKVRQQTNGTQAAMQKQIETQQRIQQQQIADLIDHVKKSAPIGGGDHGGTS